MRYVSTAVLLLFLFASCKKKECKRCFIEEYNQTTSQIQYTDAGEYCGKDLEKMEQTTFTDNSGHSAKPSCK